MYVGYDLDSWSVQGMIDPGELVSETLKREFGEETMNSLQADDDKKAKLKTQVAEFFKNGSEVLHSVLTFSPYLFQNVCTVLAPVLKQWVTLLFR